MKPHVIRLLDEARKRRACEIISTADNNKVVEIKEYRANRSASQNALMWSWTTVIANELGETKDAVHTRHKEKHLIRILERDDKEFAEMMEALRELHRQGLRKEAIFLHKRIVDMSSTTRLNVTQFTEYLNDIEKHAATLGIMLPHPDDYYIAMGTPDDAA